FTDPLPQGTGATTCVLGPVTVTSGTHTNTATAHGQNGPTALDSAPSQASYTVLQGSPPDLGITKTHSGSFVRGQTGATYTLTVTTAGTGAPSGLVTATHPPPSGLPPAAAAGNGWSCTVVPPTVTCTRSDVLAAGETYPAITLTVNVAAGAPSSVINT